MWFEVLPPFFIMVGALSTAQFLPGVINYLVLGNMYHRALHTEELRLQELRDERLTGMQPYKVKGLEALPDDD